ncbi:MAG: diversity-generating retroelement protein Avd [Alphaproteobacteria bacterium]|nr:diversity-generating retroelement protein Avd [Alphaproteobacteria bacterium]
MPPDVPVLYLHWEGFTRWLLQRTARFPRRLRFTLSNRIDGLALDVLERIIEARYGHERITALQRVNLDLEKLRLFLRIAHDENHLDHRAFAHACEQLEQAGRMTGGWLKKARA